jgi:ABC-2 type transport system permease protein
MLKIILAKELLEIKRDKRLLIGTIVLPFIMLPLIGGILLASVATQTSYIIILNENQKNYPYVALVKEYIERNGGNVIVLNSSSVTKNSTPNIIITFPKDFYNNVTDLSKRAIVYLTITISTNDFTRNLVFNALYQLSYNISLFRIEELSRQANETLNPEYIRDPLLVAYNFITVTKQPVTSNENQLVNLAKVISLILFPSATPVVFFTVEGIVGERERRTLEAILASPISPISFITAKVIIGIILGILASLGDIFGILLFSYISLYTLQMKINANMTFLFIIIILYITAILLTAAISLGLLMILGGSIRNVQLITIIITSLGLLASFSALFIDFSKVTFPLSTILILPYIQLSGSLMLYVFGLKQESIFYILITLVISIILILITSKKFDSERILLR